MRSSFTIAAPAAAALVLAGQLIAGGFFLQLGNPEASSEAREQHAAVTIRAAGCHDPATAKLTATAIGVVNGQRHSIPLAVTRLSEPGTFALRQQWPPDGRWVIQMTATNGEQFTNLLVAAGPGGVDRMHAKVNMKPFIDGDVEAMLQEGTR
ncbi:MAG TPA: hypothetical protein VMH81_29635 [Bryobacteraceae bacterium]|nr:hypothetical protein [Bryobacteraceae bacterium]HUI58301.1 hypothetical protein [Bryobacteraceae bacterium]